MRSKLEVIYNHGDHVDTKQKLRRHSTQERHKRAEINHYLRNAVSKNTLSQHIFDTGTHYHINPKRYLSASADESPYQYKDYGVITESALHELTRHLRSGVR